MRSRGPRRRPVDRQRTRTSDPVVAAELAVIAEVRRSQAPTITS